MVAGYFADPKVGRRAVRRRTTATSSSNILQARMMPGSTTASSASACHHRNERNAIIQHGTMTMVRRTALDGAGGWAEWTICEDAELGLRLIAPARSAVYVDELRAAA